jgi:hypothetical protein
MPHIHVRTIRTGGNIHDLIAYYILTRERYMSHIGRGRGKATQYLLREKREESSPGSQREESTPFRDQVGYRERRKEGEKENMLAYRPCRLI